MNGQRTLFGRRFCMLAIASMLLSGAAAAFPAGETGSSRDWNAIQALIQRADAAHDPAVAAITEWNRLAEICGPAQQRLARHHRPDECSDLSEIVRSGQITQFWDECRRLIKEHNRLATRFTRAEPSQFTDRDAVGAAVARSHRTLSAYCNTDVHAQRYPHLAALMGTAFSTGQPRMDPNWANPQYVSGAVSFTAPYWRAP